MKIGSAALLLVTCTIFSGCASPEVVTAKKATDYELSCTQLAAEMETAEEFKKKAQSEKGATGTNVAAAVFFWPALLATYSNIDDASRAADDRSNHLNKIYIDKGCVKKP